MSIKLNPTSEIKIRLGINPGGDVQAFATETCYRYMDKYVPKDTGDLRTIVDIQNDRITYESPYARYQYYGIREDGTNEVKHYTTPGTGPYWDKRMWSAEGNDVIKEIQNYIRSR